MGDKIDTTKGTIKEEVGRATDDEQLTREGQTDQAKGDIKRGVDNAGDAVKRAVDKVAD